MSHLRKAAVLVLLSFMLYSCSHHAKKQVDLLVYNATIYTVDSTFSKAEALAVRNGKIVAVGNTQDLTQKYQAATKVDAGNHTIIPGLFDAHAHFIELGKRMLQVNLRGTKSYDEMIQRVVDFQHKEHRNFITGMGWDQNSWPSKKFPTKKKLDQLFPNIPVVLTRVDGHAFLVNQKALDKAGITASSHIPGGTFVKENGKLTGVLIDNARKKIYSILPKYNEQKETNALLRAQKKCLSYGLTTVADAGISHESIQLMNKLALNKQLKIGLYPMLLYSDPHLDDYLFQGLGKNEAISCHAVKLYADGALGSRGACLRKPYTDMPGHYGKMRVNPQFIKELAQKIARSHFQLNTHAIGDSANHVVLKAYATALKGKTDRRWRVEHAQIVDPEDWKYFSKNIIPSVQPTHAISDMDWAEDRLGSTRIQYAYANKTLLDQAGLVALGTDAPVEEINPYRTFYTAITRQDSLGNPPNGFFPKQKLSRKEALKGMTIWAAYSEFLNKTKGSLVPGKQADFVILDRDIMKVSADSTLHTQVLATYIKGKKVYDRAHVTPN